MSTFFHMYGEIVLRNSNLLKGTVSQTFISSPKIAHHDANKILRSHATSNGLDLLQVDLIVKSLTRLGDYDER